MTAITLKMLACGVDQQLMVRKLNHIHFYQYSIIIKFIVNALLFLEQIAHNYVTWYSIKTLAAAPKCVTV
jgi:hypothetical protein